MCINVDEIKEEYERDVAQMEELINQLNYYTEAYDKGEPLISDSAWDDLYFKLVSLERACGFALPNSPTQKIHYKKIDKLEKSIHSHLMLSLDKTKSIEEVEAFLGDEDYIAMCKMDGLTCALTYKKGRLVKAETRGDGEVGEDITHNAYVIPSIPKAITYKKKLVVNGEIICKTNDFQQFAMDYDNPRNFAAGSIRLLDSMECSKRNLTFVAWEVREGYEACSDMISKLASLVFEGFDIVPFEKGSVAHCIECLKDTAEVLSYPIDGIVFKFNDIEYGRSLGATAHHFKNAIAFKFKDESYPSVLTNIEWTMGRSGILTPVAIFNPVEIEGSTVERASLHNISIMKALSGSIAKKGDIVYIYKANQIIPQISDWEHYEGEVLEIPSTCPYCGQPTEIRKDNDSEVLYCTNSNCEGKLINVLDHFCGKKGIDIKGLSKATLEKLIEWGWVNDISDIFKLAEHRDEWVQKAGFGVKSVDKVLAAVSVSSSCTLQQFISALGIPLIGLTAAAELAKIFPSWADFIKAVETNDYYFGSIQNFGEEMNNSLKNYNYTLAKYIIDNKYINIIYNNNNNNNIYNNNNNIIYGSTFVITGKLNHFKNRDELVQTISTLGGKVTGSVSKNTTYLINNDVNSTSSKNKSARALGIPILTEEEIIEAIGSLS